MSYPGCPIGTRHWYYSSFFVHCGY